MQNNTLSYNFKEKEPWMFLLNEVIESLLDDEYTLWMTQNRFYPEMMNDINFYLSHIEYEYNQLLLDTLYSSQYTHCTDLFDVYGEIESERIILFQRVCEQFLKNGGLEIAYALVRSNESIKSFSAIGDLLINYVKNYLINYL